MKTFWLILICFSFCGCLPKIESKPKYSQEVYQNIINACTELSSIGGYSKLASQIDLDMKEINLLLKQDNLLSVRSRVYFLSNRIKQNADRLIQMVEPRFSDRTQHQQIRWTISPQEIDARVITLGYDWSIQKIEIEALYTQQGAVSFRPEDFQIEVSKDQALVVFSRKVSILDICQFESSIKALVKVTFQDRQGRPIKFLKYLLSTLEGKP